MVDWSRLADGARVWRVDAAGRLLGLDGEQFRRALWRDLGLRPVIVQESPELGPLVFGELVRQALEQAGAS